MDYVVACVVEKAIRQNARIRSKAKRAFVEDWLMIERLIDALRPDRESYTLILKLCVEQYDADRPTLLG